MKSHYGTLNTIANGAGVFGKIGIAFAVVGALVVVATPFKAGTATNPDALAAAFSLAGGALISGVATGVVLIAFGELIHLLIDLAESSARMAELLEKAIAPAAIKPASTPAP